MDLSRETHKGHIHPISRAIFDIRKIFDDLGFEIGLGPEVESEWYNFDALIVPADQPARDMQDTFWLKQPENFQFSIFPASRDPAQPDNFRKGSKMKNERSENLVLRTHTTSVTARELEKHKNSLPIRKIFPGKVFRNEATDATHEAQFFQLDGVYVDTDVSLAHLKGVLTHFFKKFLGDDVELRFRPSYFSFTEPSVEIDVRIASPRKSTSSPCGSAWLEMMGGGMIHPNVLKAAGIDSTKWNGFAFGGGIDRMVMVKYGIDDIRLLYGGDLRLVSQF